MSAWSVRRAKRRERVSRRIEDEEKLGNTEIGRLRHRFIRIAMIAISVILLFILIIINGTMGVIININLNRSLIRIAGEQPDGYYTQADEGALQSLGAQLMPNVRITSVDYYVLTVDTNGTVLSTDAHTMSELTAVQEADMVSLTVLHNHTLEPGRTVKFSYAGESYAARVVDKEAQTQAKAEASAGASDSASSPSASSASSLPSPSSPASASSDSASPAPSPTSSAYNSDNDENAPAQDGTIDIVFLNYTEVHNWQRQLLDMSVIIAFLSVFVFWLVVVSLSRRAVEPSIKTLQTQKRFITNASHELKTPVSIISADAEVLEAVNGENEWTRSIINQSNRLNDLISALVSLTKAGENEKFHLADVDMTQLATKAAQDFAPVIQQAGKTLQTHIQDDVHAQAELRSITEVLNILLDNSAKYCDDGGMVDITLAPRQGIRGGVALTVSNDYKDGAGQDYSRFFERFYRADESHNSGKQGFGIGLAMAQELVTRMNGTVDASWHDGRISFTVNLR